jgi:hypothetical protein
MTNLNPQLGSMPKDQNGNSVQIGTSFATIDVSATPKSSPFSLTGGIDIIAVPSNAVEFIVNPTNNPMKISSSPTLVSWDLIATNTKESVPCARMPFIYVKGGTSDNLNFRFTII